MNKNLSLVSNDINQLPNNIEAEQAVIGSVLTSNEIFDDISSIISENNLFLEISQTIVGQQISFLAADAVWKRLLNSVNKKKDFLNLFENKNLKWARQQGLSERKYEYIRDLSLKIKKRDISLVKMSKLDDEFGHLY